MRLVPALFFSMAAAGPSAAANLELDARTGFTIPMEVNGQVLRIRVDPGAPGYLVLNPAAVARLGLKPSLIGSRTSVGPIVLHGHTKSVKLRVDGATLQPRAVWIDRNVVEDADGVISPQELPFDTVSFRLRPQQRGEHTTALMMSYSNSAGINLEHPAGDKRLELRFTTIDRHSMATASAAAQLAAEYGSQWTGDSRPEPVRFGIVRPIRPMMLNRPLDLSGFKIRDFLVRIGDNRGDYSLPTEDGDPDEIVVTGKTKGKQPARLSLMVGQDTLSRCSSLSYGKGARVLTLQCTGVSQ